jgi:hypothetical protein
MNVLAQLKRTLASQLRLPVTAASEHRQTLPATLVADWRLLVLLLGGAAFLCANLYSWRLQPFLLGGDQVFLWTAAWRMLLGDRLYQDYLQFTPPGVHLIYLGLFRVFGPRIWVTNAMALALGVLSTGLCYALARQIMDRSRAFLASWLFLVVLYGRLLCVTHHWCSTLTVLAATLILMQGLTTRRLLAAGALLGLASFFTQTRGVIACMVVVAYLLWEARQRRLSVWMLSRQVGLLVAAFSVSLAALYAYFIRSVGFKLLWDLQVSYVGHYKVRNYKADPLDLGLPHELTLHNLPALAQYLAVYALAPLACGIVLLQRVLSTRQPSAAGSGTWDPVLLLSLVACALLAEVATDISWLRLYCVAMPCMVLFIWLIGERGWLSSSPPLAGAPGRFRGMRAEVSWGLHVRVPVLLWAVVVVLGLQQVWGRQTSQQQLLHLPGGSAVMSADAAERYGWLSQHTRPGDLFLNATWPGCYMPLALRPPIYLDYFGNNSETRPEWVERSIRQLEQHPVRYIMFGPVFVETPARRSGEYNVAPFLRFLKERYQFIRTFANGEQVWERRSDLQAPDIPGTD